MDQGTHASRALLVDARGRVAAAFQAPVALSRRGPRVEQDARALRESVRQVLSQALGEATARGLAPTCAALATQRSTVVAWDRGDGRPLAPALSWQDTRTGPGLGRYAHLADALHRRTGLRLSAHYGATKLAWLLRECPPVARAADTGGLALGPLAAFLLQDLLAGRPLVVDDANASRTLLWSIAARDWDPWLLAAFGLQRRWLPACRRIRADYGVLRAAPGLRLRAVSGDQTAALFADGPPAADTVYVNLGTGAFVLAVTGATPRLDGPLLAGPADSGDGRSLYSLEGTVNGAGGALQWARRQWGIRLPDTGLDAALETVRAPPVFLNAVGGLGSPWWRSDVAPRLVGADPAACRQAPALCMAAVLESIAFMVQANLAELQAAGVAPSRLRLSGGLSRCTLLCRRIADLSGLPVLRSEQPEATARGAAWLALDGPADWRPSPHSLIEPQPDPGLEARYARFLAAVAEATA